MTTNAELAEEMRAMKAEMEELMKLKNAMQEAKMLHDDPNSVVKREDKPGPGGGWVIFTPNKINTIRMRDVNIKGGIGIVNVDDVDAEKKVHCLEYDYGYRVKAVEAPELLAFYKKQNEAKEDKNFAEKLVK